MRHNFVYSFYSAAATMFVLGPKFNLKDFRRSSNYSSHNAFRTVLPQNTLRNIKKTINNSKVISEALLNADYFDNLEDNFDDGNNIDNLEDNFDDGNNIDNHQPDGDLDSQIGENVMINSDEHQMKDVRQCSESDVLSDVLRSKNIKLPKASIQYVRKKGALSKVVSPASAEKSCSVIPILIEQLNEVKVTTNPKDGESFFDIHFNNDKLGSVPTVKEFCTALNEISLTHGWTNSSVNDLLTLLRDTTTSLRLPFLNKRNISPNTGPVTGNKIASYTEADGKGLVIDICKNGCMAFMGDTDSVEAMYCFKCKSPRYSACFHHDCTKNKFKTYEDCNPNKGGHDIKYRKPMQTMYYRSIIAKLMEVYCLSQLPGYEEILNYRKLRYSRKGCIIDILDGSRVKAQYSIMNEKFLLAKKEFELLHPGEELIQCSLGLTVSYDGVMNFKRKADSMWPLLFSILDCNPGHRTTLGLGMNLNSLHNVAMGSEAEKFLVRNCLTEELKTLEKGIVFKVEDVSGKTKYVYLQARCIFSHLDTKALEKFAMIQGSNSKNGCTLCNQCNGCYRLCTSSTCYIGARIGLSDNHYLRFIGETPFEEEIILDKAGEPVLNEHGDITYKTASEQQEEYYSGAKSAQTKLSALLSTVQLNKTDKVIPPIAPPKSCMPRNFNFDWYNYDFPPEMFKNLRYPHPDTRKFVENIRTSTLDYFTRGDVSTSIFNAYRLWLGDKPLPKKPKDCSYMGVTGICPLVEELDAFEFTNFVYDLMHYLSNKSHYLFNLYKGIRHSRNEKYGGRMLAVAQKKHPSMMYVKAQQPWEASSFEQDLMDAVINSIIIPSHYNTDYGLRYPFKQTGFLRSKQHMVWLTVFAPYILSFSSMEVDYKNYAARFASDICALLNPCIETKTLELKTIPSVDETRGVYLGIYPDSEQAFITHQIVDIVRHIEPFGHVRGLMCFAPERANSVLSDCITKGGTNYMKTMYFRYVLKENYKLRSFIDNKDENMDNEGLYTDFNLKLCGDVRSVQCTVLESNLIFKTLFDFLEAEQIDKLGDKSPFYRLYKAYEYIRSKNTELWSKNTELCGFRSWLLAVDKILTTSNQKQSIEELLVPHYMVKYVKNCKSENPYFDDYGDAATGTVYSRDFKAVASDLLSLNGNPSPKAVSSDKSSLSDMYVDATFSKVIIKGITFRCRGLENMEDNDLSSMWDDHRHSASWCMINNYKVVTEMVYVESDTEEEEEKPVSKKSKIEHGDAAKPARKKKKVIEQTRVDKKPLYGQINYCFRVNLPSDPLVHGVAIGHITTRTTQPKSHRGHCKISVGTANPPKPRHRYFCLNHVASTAIGLSGLNNNNLPLLKSRYISSFTRAFTDQTKGTFAATGSPLHQLYLIELHPERVNFEYESVEEDLNNTKCFEKRTTKTTFGPTKSATTAAHRSDGRRAAVPSSGPGARVAAANSKSVFA